MKHCFTTFLPFLPLYLRGKKVQPLTYMLSFWCGHAAHVELCIDSAKRPCDTQQHHTDSSAHSGCSLLFINTMQTVQCGCIWNRKIKALNKQIHLSSFLLFGVFTLCYSWSIEVIWQFCRRVRNLFLNFCFVCRKKFSICHSLFFAIYLYKMLFKKDFYCY